jgi:CheY-like chemotaxis protein
MPNEPAKRKQFLFLDDDSAFLAAVREIFSEMARGSWEIYTAENHARALEILRKTPIDVVVVDLEMPVIDGLEFMRLLTRTHPGQQIVILTGDGSEEKRKKCLEAGATLFLEKLISPDGFAAVFAALDALASVDIQDGFRGLMRRVGLQEVLQMECLARKSSVLEISTGKVRGRIFICDGAIVHAESRALQGEVALYGLLALRGGEFNFLPFEEPKRRTIAGQWESLLMEAARLSDEGAQFLDPKSMEGSSAMQERPEPDLAVRIRIEEILLCSGAGEVLYEWECPSLESRLQLLDLVEQQGKQLAEAARVGMFERLEIRTSRDRMICQVQPHRRFFVRSTG